jgi:hypothetical protein
VAYLLLNLPIINRLLMPNFDKELISILISIDQTWPKCGPQAISSPPDFFAALRLKFEIPISQFFKENLTF